MDATDRRARILVVEDSPTQAEQVRILLEGEGFEVETAGDGEAALARCTASRFDLVLTDIVMPGMDGYKLCATLKSDPKTAAIPVILLTTLKEATDIIHGLECGADNFVTKPYDSEYLVGRVRNILAARGLRSERRVKVGVEVLFMGRRFKVTSDIEQILDFLVSTFEEFSRTKQREFETRFAEAKRRIEEPTYRFFTLSLDMLGIAGFDGYLRQVNPAWETTLGFSTAELTSKPWTEFVHPDDREATLAGIERLKTGRDGSFFENRLLCKNGSERWVLWSMVAFGAEELIYAVGRDMTDRKVAEEALKASREQFRLILDSTAEAIYGTDPDGNCTFCNPACLRLLGYERPEDLLGRNMHRLIHHTRPDGTPCRETECRIRQALKRGEGSHADDEVFCRADGTAFAAEYWSHPIRREGEIVGAVVNFLDVTERKRAEARCLAHARQHEAVADLGQRALEGAKLPALMDEAVATVARTLEVEYCGLFELLRDRRALRLRAGVGWKEGRVGEALVPVVEGAVEGCVLSSSTAVIAGDLRAETCFVPNPLLVDHGVTSGMCMALRAAGRLSGIIGAYSTGKRAFTSDEAHFLQAVANVIATAIAREETEARLQRSEEQLRQAQKMEAIGRLAGGVAHDFNNMLTAITGYSDLIMAGLASGDPIRADIEQIRRAAERAAALTRQLLAFSRKEVREVRVVDLNSVISDMNKMTRRLIGEDIELVTSLDPAVGCVKVDPGQIEQVVLNLVVNARDAMPRGGTITIETRNIDLDADYASLHLEVKPGPYVMLALSDTGCGMDEKTLAHLFEPFFTTKAAGTGTGLGLSTVYGIVKQSDGHIMVYTEPGHGTTFKIYLPRVEERPATARPGGPTAGTVRGSETILLVEDDDMLRTFARRVLQKNGYVVLEARNGGEALLLSERHAGPIDLMLSDVVMPQLSGPELAGRVSAKHAEINVLFMSGYTEAIAQHRILVEGQIFLPKPFTQEVLLRKVREALEGSPQRASTRAQTRLPEAGV